MNAENKSCNTDLALKLVLFSQAALIIIYLAYRLRLLIVSIIFAATLASAMAPLVEALEKRKIPRIVTVVFIYAAVLASYALLAALLFPTMNEQWHKLSDSLPQYWTALSAWYQSALNPAGYQSNPLVLSMDEIRNLMLGFLHRTLSMTAGIVGLALNVTMIVLLAAYFAIDADKIWTALLRWIPQPAYVQVESLIHPLAGRMGGYVRGQLLVALCVASFLVAGFSLLRIKYALVLGILAGFLNLLPYIGSLVACILAVVVAFNQTPILALAVLFLCAIEQWIESAFMVPVLLGKQASLHPLVVLISIFIGATLMGIPGALVSVPIATAAGLLAEEYWLKRSTSSHDSRLLDKNTSVSCTTTSTVYPLNHD